MLWLLQSFRGVVPWGIILAGLIAIWFYVPTYIWQYILLLRVPILLGIVLLFGFPILANVPGQPSALFQNLFVMRGRWQLTTVLVSSTMAGLMVSFISALMLANAPARFEIPPLVTLPMKAQYGLTALLISPTWIAAICLSIKELGGWLVFQGCVFGITGSLVFVWAVNRAEQILNSWQEFKQFLASWILLFAKQHPQGYLDAQNGLTTGHLLGITLSFVGLLVYVLVIFFYRPTLKQALGEAPALLYALLLIWIGTLLLSGATFYSDYFHVPVIIFFILFSALIYAVLKVGHFFKLTDIDTAFLDSSKPADLVNFKKAIDERLKYQEQKQQKRTIVVVCASGGGIQAAGWTVQVLKGLQEELSPSFPQAIGLISSASGGSVGTMYFLDRFDPELGYPPTESLEQIFNSATQDSLDAVGWGLAYPDFVRAIGLPFLVNRYTDRAEAMEIDWQREMMNPKATLAGRRQQILKGKVPIHVSNATLVEDGCRFLISPMTFIKDGEDRKALDFNTLYPGCDLSVTSAARLSSTFPYVSPIARNDRDLKRNYHIADGGYFDNTGLFTVIEWLDEWLDPSKNLNIERVLLLQINAFPESKLKETVKGNRGWWMEWIGPLLALYGVRDSTQVARNMKESELLKERWKGKVEIEPFIIFFPESYNQPLSWKFTQQQKSNLRQAWDDLRRKRSSVVEDIKRLWLYQWDMH